jgi:hypothetical protein
VDTWTGVLIGEVKVGGWMDGWMVKAREEWMGGWREECLARRNDVWLEG